MTAQLCLLLVPFDPWSLIIITPSWSCHALPSLGQPIQKDELQAPPNQLILEQINGADDKSQSGDFEQNEGRTKQPS